MIHDPFLEIHTASDPPSYFAFKTIKITVPQKTLQRYYITLNHCSILHLLVQRLTGR